MEGERRGEQERRKVERDGERRRGEGKGREGREGRGEEWRGGERGKRREKPAYYITSSHTLCSVTDKVPFFPPLTS